MILSVNYKFSIVEYSIRRQSQPAQKTAQLIGGWGMQNEVKYVLKIVDGWGCADNAMPVGRA